MGRRQGHTVARWDQHQATSSRLLAGLIDQQHRHDTTDPCGIPAGAVTKAVVFMDTADLVALAATAVLHLADLDGAGRPLCTACRTPTWPDQATAVIAAHRHARRYGMARSVRPCPAGAGWHHTRRDPLEARS